MAAKRKESFVIAGTLSLAEWLNYAEMDEFDRPIRIDCSHFPTDRHLKEYLLSIDDRSDSQIKSLLRSFLPMGGMFGGDHRRLEAYFALGEEDAHRLYDDYEYVRRLLDGTAGNKRHVWEGLSWVIDLLPHFPTQAIAAIEAYDLSHYFILPDGRASGLSDCTAIIRAKYLEAVTDKNLAETLTPREFEFLVASTYIADGYRVHVTQQTRDGGHDIIASKDLPNLTERVLIECKRMRAPVPIEKVRALMGILGTYKASRGVLVSTSKFTKPTIEFAKGTARINLIDHNELCRRLNTIHGSEWPSRISQIIVSARAKIANDT